MLKSLFSFSSMTFLSRISGFIRDVLVARIFGVSIDTDAFFVAFRIPNLFRRIFAEGSFSLSFMPILAEVKNQNKQAEVDFIARTLGILTTIVMLFSLVGSICAPLFIWVMAPGLEPSVSQKANELLTIMFPYIALISLSAFFQSILHSYQRFAIGAITPIFLNIALILSLLFLSKHLQEPIYALAIGVLIGGVLQFIWPFIFAHRLKVLSKPKFKQNDLTKKTIKNMVPIIFSSSVSQINILIDTLLASLLVSGSISWLYYANRLLELPIGMIGVALATVGISIFSNLYQKNQLKELNQSIYNCVSLALITGIACFFGLFFFAQSIMVSLFQYGNFNLYDAQMSAYALKAYALSVPMILLIKVFSSIFFAMGDTKTPSRIAVFTIGINLVFNVSLMQFFGHIGLALASSISTSFNALILFLALRKNKNFTVLNKSLLKQIFYLIAIALAISLIIIFGLDYLGISLDPEKWLKMGVGKRLTIISFIIIVFAVSYLACTHYFVYSFHKFSKG